MSKKPLEKKKKILIGVVLSIIALIIIIFILFKIFGKVEYTVTFDTDGGSVIESFKVKENAKIKKPTNPTKKGYTFEGWYYENKLFDFKNPITRNMTLKAHWEKNEIKIKSTAIELKAGDEKLIEVLELPKGLKEEDIIYELSEEGIISIDGNGKIKAIKAGKVIVTVRTKDGKYKTFVTVVVNEEPNTEEVSSTATQSETNSNTTGKTTTTTKKPTTSSSNAGSPGSSGSSTPAPSTPSTTPQPSTPTPQEDKYTLTIYKLQKQDGSIDQYEIGGATKNGASFTDFNLVGISGSYYPKSGNYLDSDIIGTPTTATLVKNGSVVATASIIWQTKSIQ